MLLSDCFKVRGLIVLIWELDIPALHEVGRKFYKDIEMTTTKQPIQLYVFYHDDVEASTRRTVPRAYLKDCITELQQVTGRQFIMEYRHSIPGLTDIEYKGDAGRALSQWEGRVNHYADMNNLASDGLQRFLLVTQDSINEQVLGITRAWGVCLIASLTSYQTIAHELGHTLGAKHEDAELQRNAFGLVCETYVYPEHSTGRANCYQYSLKNRQNIAEFLAGRA